MPTATYRNLSGEKQKRIYEALVREFEDKPLNEVTVKHIVEQLHLPRGSFYQYFTSLSDCYFYVLDQEILELHTVFMELMKVHQNDLFAALESLGEKAADEIYESEHRRLYKNRYLSFDTQTEKEWAAYQRRNAKPESMLASISEKEKVQFVRAIVHSLIQRIFTESWDRETFLAHYNQHVKWMKEGLQS